MAGKQKRKARNLVLAQELQAKKKRYGWLALVAGLAAVIVFLIYNTTVTMGIFDNENQVMVMMVYMTFLVFAGVVGVLTHKWSRASRELKGHLQASGIKKEDL